LRDSFGLGDAAGQVDHGLGGYAGYVLHYLGPVVLYILSELREAPGPVLNEVLVIEFLVDKNVY
jgi:hypothetical protein